jgi:hypothetical protein
MAAAQTGNPRGRYGTKRDPSRKRHERTSTTETVRILRLNTEGISASEIARVTGIAQQTVLAVIHRHEPTMDKALDVLKASSFEAAVQWVKSFGSASRRGEHRPMKDALVAVGVIQADPQNLGVTVIVGSGLLPSDELSTIEIAQPAIASHNITPATSVLASPYPVSVSAETDK